MGYWEFAVCLKNNKYSPEDLTNEIMKRFNTEDIYCPVSVIGKATIKRNIKGNKIKIFGKCIKIKKMKLQKNKDVLIIGKEGSVVPNKYALFPFDMANHVKIYNITYILSLINYNYGYEEIFEDKNMIVNGKGFYPKLAEK